MDEEPILFVNGTILTMDGDRPRAESLLVEGGRISAVGNREDMGAGASRARTIDLAGGALIPGFNDSHCHILGFGLNLERLDVSPEAAESIEDIERLIADRARTLGPDEWVLGRGYDQNLLREGRHPTREDLDRAASGRPVVLWHTSGHVLAANSRALERAGITANTATPAGSEIARDEHGTPTGVLKEAPAMQLVTDAISPPSVETGRDAILRAMQAMAKEGVTSASDAATGWHHSVDSEMQMYREALVSGLATRITLMPEIHHVAPPGSEIVHRWDEFETGNEPDWLRIGPTKIFSDGALSTRTAALRQPYEGTDDRGILIWDPRTLDDMVDRAHAAGWQIAVHALGDRAIETVLDAYEAALARNPRDDHRHRIEHCMLPDEGLAKRMQRLGVIPSLQPDIFRLGDGYITALGPDRAQQVIPVGLFERLGVRYAFSSDRPVVPGDPLECIHDAMIRRTPSGVVLGPEHRVSAEDAIRAYTLGGAYATRTEDRVGTLRPGMLADLAVLSTDPTRIPGEEFSQVRVMMTIAGGRVVFE